LITKEEWDSLVALIADMLAKLKGFEWDQGRGADLRKELKKLMEPPGEESS